MSANSRLISSQDSSVVYSGISCEISFVVALTWKQPHRRKCTQNKAIMTLAVKSKWPERHTSIAAHALCGIYLQL
ncbi:CLUMA_CG000521, isoform A [Clunio marinus]|uniref:CLUMA_CG000521, isoform A n=1 Tax=Clunio marinus TaxID=568069 RepID=A0A1J1HFC5_9DIPT|nr:CLUMA_CG000521, isoform A [Clunio marinus]